MRRSCGWFSVAVLLAACDGSPVLRAQAVAAGGYHSCALVAGGQVECWGQNSGDQLGDDEPTPVAVVR